MSNVHANPDDLERFCAQLNKYLQDVLNSTGTLQRQYDRLGQSWNDIKSAQFEEEFRRLVHQIQAFNAQSKEMIPRLQNMAERLRAYLATR